MSKYTSIGAVELRLTVYDNTQSKSS